MKNKKIMVVAAHPDDADFYCGGALARWIQEGARVTYVICTDGALGADDEKNTMAELAAIRQKEQNEANRTLGVSETVYLGYPDLSLTAGEELRYRIAREYRIHKPDILITFDPWARYELHPDHTVAGRETIYARLAARLPLRYPELNREGLNAWPINDLYLMKTDNPNTWIETEDFLKLKLHTLMCHMSQFAFLASNEESGLAVLRMMSRTHPKTGRIVETFKHMPLEGLEGLKAYIGLE
jgi:LmbE family N-acetylglucosaminyl deacetylase